MCGGSFLLLEQFIKEKGMCDENSLFNISGGGHNWESLYAVFGRSGNGFINQTD